MLVNTHPHFWYLRNCSPLYTTFLTSESGSLGISVNLKSVVLSESGNLKSVVLSEIKNLNSVVLSDSENLNSINLDSNYIEVVKLC